MKRTFEEWMAQVNKILIAKVGLESSDLPDIAYLDMYEDGKSPKSAASAAIRYALEG